METAAYSLGLGCVILGSLLNDVPALIDLLNLPEYTYPVLGITICAIPSAQLIRSAIRSRRMRSIPV